MIAGLIVSVIFAWALCLFIGIFLNIPSNLSEALSDPCRKYTLDFLFGSSIGALVFILIAVVFRKHNKFLLSVILVPSSFFGFYLIASTMFGADNNISSYGYLANTCHIFGVNTPKHYKSNPELDKKWDSLQSRLFNKEITNEEFDKERELLILEQENWRKENP
jgi:hypothetical protein